MSLYQRKDSILFRAITLALACLFTANSTLLADPDTLAPRVGSPEIYQAMRGMMEDSLAAHQKPIDEFIRTHSAKVAPLSAIPDLVKELIACIRGCDAENMLTRLKTTLSSAGGQIQVIFAKTEEDLPMLGEKRVWGHAGRYVTAFALESEKLTKEGRRKIIGRLFHEIRARSKRAKELFDDEFGRKFPRE
jgi:hypothetical protein